MKASDVMTSKVVSIAPESSLTDMIRLMLDYRISGYRRDRGRKARRNDHRRRLLAAGRNWHGSEAIVLARSALRFRDARDGIHSLSRA